MDRTCPIDARTHYKEQYVRKHQPRAPKHSKRYKTTQNPTRSNVVMSTETLIGHLWSRIWDLEFRLLTGDHRLRHGSSIQSKIVWKFGVHVSSKRSRRCCLMRTFYYRSTWISLSYFCSSEISCYQRTSESHLEESWDHWFVIKMILIVQTPTHLKCLNSFGQCFLATSKIRQFRTWDSIHFRG